MIEGLMPCNVCNALPNIGYDGKSIRFDCPICNGMSATAKNHGIDVAIADWNRWHGKRVQDANKLSDRELILKFLDICEKMHPYKKAGYPETYSQYNEAWADAVDMIRGYIEKKCHRMK